MMAAENLEHSLAQIFGHEGGLSMDASDPGNWTGGKIHHGDLKGTKYGIAANSYPHEDIRHLTIERATEIYRRDYAAKISFDDLPAGVDFGTLDYAVNSGTHKAAMDLQRAVSVADDGHIGPLTIKAVKAADPLEVIHHLCNRRLAFMHRLSTWPTYGKGWTRRVEAVRAEALRMAGA
jgi:lysozyme family protein